MSYYVFSDNQLPGLKINQIGCSCEGDITGFGPCKRGVYIIHYVLSGSGYFNSCPVNAGQGFLITPSSFDKYCPDEKNPWKFLWIVSNDNQMNSYFKCYNADEKTRIFNFDCVETLENTEKFLKENNEAFLSSSVVTELYLKIFNSHVKIKPYEILNSSDVYINFVTNFIAANYSKNVTVKELTEKTGISQPYLYKIFLKKYNVSPKEYIDNEKLKKAQNLLAETTVSISDIACSLGYSDVHAFSKFFRKKMHSSPSEYRKKPIKL